MECRETRTLLTAFHDGELPAAGRARVGEHLRGCPECAALLANLAMVDRAAGVPDPGPEYWDRFNARVMDRVEREADGPGVRVLRPKGGWMREQLRYLVPAAAGAALVVVIAYYGGIDSGVPPPAAPPPASRPAAPESDGRGSSGAGAGRDATGSVAPAGATKTAERAAVAPPVPPLAPAREQVAAVAREERYRPADRSLPAGDGEALRGRAAAPPAVSAPSPTTTFRGVPTGSPPAAAADGMTQGNPAERKEMERAAAPMAERHVAGKAESASGTRIAKEASAVSPCELTRTLAEQERFREAETAQRACLSGDLDAPSREKGLVFLAELLDRQERFSEADAVIADVDRRFPQSRPLDLYRRQRPMVQQQPKAVPVTR